MLKKLTVRDRLREETRAAHNNVDDLYSRLDLTAPQDYRVFLTAHLAAMTTLEAMVERAPLPAALREGMVAYTPLIRHDLEMLGARPEILPQPPADAAAGSDAFAIGLIYVKAGSRMGAQVLLDQACLSADRFPCAYLGERNGIAYWRTVRRFLEDNHAVLQADYPKLKTGALAGFNLFESAFYAASSAHARTH